MKKTIAILLCLMLTLTMLAACAKTETEPAAADKSAAQTAEAPEQGSDAAEQTTIVWQSWDSYSKYEAAILAFEQAHPEIHVEYEQVSDILMAKVEEKFDVEYFDPEQ